MIGKMERTGNKERETYIGVMVIENKLCIQTAIKINASDFVTQRLLLSKEAVETLVPLLNEYLSEFKKKRPRDL